MADATRVSSLIAAPTAASPRGLSSLRAAVMMAGEREWQDLMKAGMRAMLAAHVPSTFMVIPEATHGCDGPDPGKNDGRSARLALGESKI